MNQKVTPVTPDYLSPQELSRCLRAMAALDIVMVPEEQDWLRLVSVCPDGGGYTVDNGGGDTIDIFFAGEDAFIKGFDHENELNQFGAGEWDGDFFRRVYAGVPQRFLDLYEDEEVLDYMTFCMWYDHASGCWKRNAVEGNDGGSEYLLGYIRRDAVQWARWAADYYEREIAPETVEKAYRGEALTAEDVRALNPERDAAEALRELAAPG